MGETHVSGGCRRRAQQLIDPAYLGPLSRAAGLAIDPGYRQDVALHLQRLMEQARLVMQVPLPAEAEPAPIFRP